MSSFWPLLALFISRFFLACAGLSNRTIDDTLGDPLTNTRINYPSGEWYTPSLPCPPPFTQCPPNLDITQTLNATWHSNVFHSNNSTTELPRAEVIFTGSTVSVRCVLSFSDNPRLFQTSMAFYLDGDHVGDYNVATSGGNSLAYDTLVYANNSLGLGRHNLTIVNGRADDQWYLMILDYIEYTAEVSDPPTPATSTESKSTPSKTKVLTGVLIAICLLFGIVLAYFIYRVYSSRSRRRIGQAQGDVELLPASPKQASHPTMWGWFRRYLNLNVSKRSISFNPTLLVAGRPRLRSESTKDLSGRHSPAIFEDEMDTHSKKPISEGRWAFIASWRDRAVREAEIPSLPPTSHAPTTVVSGPVLGHPENHTIQPLRIQSQQPETPGSQRPVRRGFTVMNT